MSISQKTVDHRATEWVRLGYKPECFGCGHCDGTWGYNVTLPNGKQSFLCGHGVLDLPDFGDENVAEVKEAIRIQDAFFMAQINKQK